MVVLDRGPLDFFPNARTYLCWTMKTVERRQTHTKGGFQKGGNEKGGAEVIPRVAKSCQSYTKSGCNGGDKIIFGKWVTFFKIKGESLHNLKKKKKNRLTFSRSKEKGLKNIFLT